MKQEITIKEAKKLAREALNKSPTLAKVDIARQMLQRYDVKKTKVPDGTKPVFDDNVSLAASLFQKPYSKRAAMARKRRHASRPSTSRATGSTKWDLLRTIEECQDLGKTTKKALIELVYEETLR